MTSHFFIILPVYNEKLAQYGCTTPLFSGHVFCDPVKRVIRQISLFFFNPFILLPKLSFLFLELPGPGVY
jgi:hypothetical protein